MARRPLIIGRPPKLHLPNGLHKVIEGSCGHTLDVIVGPREHDRMTILDAIQAEKDAALLVRMCPFCTTDGLFPVPVGGDAATRLAREFAEHARKLEDEDAHKHEQLRFAAAIYACMGMDQDVKEVDGLLEELFDRREKHVHRRRKTKGQP